MPENVLFWILPNGSTEVPRIVRSTPSFPSGLVGGSLLTVFPVMVNDAMFVLKLSICTSLCGALSMRLLVKVTAPLTFARSTPSSVAPVAPPVAASVTLLRLSVKPLIPLPLIPSVPLFVTFM